MMTCDDADQLVALRAVGALEHDQTAELHLHLQDCPSCRGAASVYRQTTDLLPLALTELEPPARLRHRIMTEVYADVRVQRPSLAQRLWARVPNGRGYTLSAAASLAFAAAVLVLFVSHRGGTVAPATGPVEVALAPSANYSGLRGTLEYAPTTHDAVLVVDGLPTHPSIGVQNAVYELWMLPRSGAPQPAGYLAMTPDGAHWTAGMRVDNLRDYTAVSATVEPAGGSSAPSDRAVFTGQLPPT